MFKKGDVVRIKDNVKHIWPNTVAIHGWVYLIEKAGDLHISARSLSTGLICGFTSDALEKADVQEG